MELQKLSQLDNYSIVAVRDDGVIYVAGHPLLNRSCTRPPGCIRLRNDLQCVEWGLVKVSLFHCVSALLHLGVWEVRVSSSVLCTVDHWLRVVVTV